MPVVNPASGEQRYKTAAAHFFRATKLEVSTFFDAGYRRGSPESRGPARDKGYFSCKQIHNCSAVRW
jgi:hypothetical protein